MMKLSDCVSVLADPKSRRTCFCSLFPTAALLCVVFFLGSAFIATDYKEKLSRWDLADSMHSGCTKCENSSRQDVADRMQNTNSTKCENQCSPDGSEALPRGIVSKTSNLGMRPLWGFPKEKLKSSVNLFTVAVGIKQKELVHKMVKKFLSSDFVVMLFHYDGNVDGWKDLDWNNHVIHVSAINQTKWWFAKRFLHPDIVAEYSYIFLWDEDLGVDNFNPKRYVSVVEDEGLEISQPGLDSTKSEVHHLITVRGRRSFVHRRAYKPPGSGQGCDDNSTAPPCTGWIEVMAPVFSKAAWRCVWYMIQNDLIHGWGLDMQLGYCAQGDRTKNVGVVDSEFIVHHGLPTLGRSDEKNKTSLSTYSHTPETKNTTGLEAKATSKPNAMNFRYEVRRQSYIELEMFKQRWEKAVEEDECWTDPTKSQ